MAEVFTRRINIYIDSGQAQVAYDKLTAQQARLTAEVKKYADAGKEAPAKLKKSLEEVTAAADRQQKKLSGDLAPSLKDITASYTRLSRELNAMSKQDPGFEKKRQQTVAAKSALDQYRNSLGAVGKGFSDMLRNAGGVAFGVLIGNTVQSGLQAVSSYISGFFTRIAKLSDELADIRKTTNLSAKEVEDLNKKLSSLDTRTSTSDLRGIAAVGGQFAVAKNDLADFTKEVDRVNVALGDKFGNNAETVATEMAKLRNIFKDVKTQSIADDILHIGNALNELENAGAATSDVVADFANRIGGIGIPLGLTSGQVLGISATLQELGVNAERGGTAVSKILQKMTVNVEDFAAIAGIGVNEFTELLNNDLFAAFSKVIDGSQKGGASATALARLLKDAELSGSGASEVFLKLGSNTSLMADKVKLASDALKSNSSIMQEFNAKNRNTAGELEILNKRIAAAFANPELNRAIAGLVHNLTLLTEATDKNVKAAQQEYLQLVSLESKILDVNTPQEERVRLVKELQTQYPGYLGNINAETSSTNELTTAFIALNNQMIARITLASQQDKIEEAQKKASDLQMKRLEQEDKARELMAEAIQSFKLDQQKIFSAGTTDKQIETTISLIRKMQGEMGLVGFAALDQKGIFQEIVIAQGYLNNYKTQENKASEASNRLLQDKLDLAKRLGIEEQKQSGTFLVQPPGTFATPPDIPNPNGTGDKEKKAKEDMAAFIKKLREDLYLDLLSENAREIAAVRLKYDHLREQAKGNSEALRLIKEQEALELTDVMIRQQQEAAKAPKPLLKSIDQVKASLEKLNTIPLPFDAQRESIIKFREALKGIQDEFQMVMGVFQSANDFLSVVFQGIDQNERQALAKDKRYNDEKKKNLKSQLDGKRITQRQYNREVERLDEQLDEQKKELAIKAFKREKALKITQVVINTATSVMNMLATAPWPVNIVMAALAAATGIAQGIIIGKSEPPEYGEGDEAWRKGIGGKKHSHRSRGNPVLDPDTGETIARLEQGEAIIPADSTAANPGVITALIRAKGKSIADQYPFERKALNVSRSAENIMFERGGVFGRLTSSILPTNSDDSGGRIVKDSVHMGDFIKEQNKLLIEEFRKSQDKKVIFVKNDYDQFNRNNDESVLRTTFDRG